MTDHDVSERARVLGSLFQRDREVFEERFGVDLSVNRRSGG
jgi:hypothetical protein